MCLSNFNVLHNIFLFIQSYIAVQMSFLQSEYAAVEEDDHVQVCVVSSCPCPVQTKVRMIISPGTAVEGSDYPPQSLSVTLAVGEEDACTNVRVTNDVDPEDPETLEITLMNDESYSIGNPGYITVTITDTDGRYCTTKHIILRSFYRRSTARVQRCTIVIIYPALGLGIHLCYNLFD